MPLATLILGLAVSAALWHISVLIMAVMLKAPWTEAVLFAGPRLVQGGREGRRWEIRLLPLTSSVRYDEEAMERMSPVTDILLLLAGPLTGGLVGWWLSATPVESLIARGWLGTLHPIGVGAPSLKQWWASTSAAPISALGTVVLLHAMINVLPLPMTNGGLLIMRCCGRRLNAAKPKWFLLIGALASIWLVLAWLIAGIAAMW